MKNISPYVLRCQLCGRSYAVVVTNEMIIDFRCDNSLCHGFNRIIINKCGIRYLPANYSIGNAAQMYLLDGSEEGDKAVAVSDGIRKLELD